MAQRGRRPVTATLIKLARGNPGKRPLPKGEPVVTGPIEKPRGLRGKASELWDTYILPAFWLRWPDAPMATLWCELQAEFERSPQQMLSSRIGQLRACASELGLTPAARARIATGEDDTPADDVSRKYFG